MKAEDAYLTSIGLMYALAAAPGWDGTVPPEQTLVSKDVNGVFVGFQSLVGVGDRYQLQFKHVIVALLETLNALEVRNRFCFTQTTMYLYGKTIGDMAIGRQPDAYGVNVTMGNLGPISNITQSENPTEGGQIVDPEDPDFVISYEMTGDSIPCQTLLNAALNGMANSAVFANHDRCGDFGGFSRSGTVAYTIRGSQPGVSGSVLSYIMVRTVLDLLPKRLYQTRNCREVGFDLIHSGEKLGVGSFFLF